MKTAIFRCGFFLILFSVCTSLLAQTPPNGINYQAIARDNNGLELLSTPITIRFSVNAGSATGSLSYQETQNAITNQFGLFSLVIGQGTKTGGSAATLATVDWQGTPQFLTVEFSQGAGFTVMGSAQYMSVPYAFSSAYANNITSGNGSVTLPSGSTGQRPASPVTGDIRYNTSLKSTEIYTGTVWININTPPVGATYIQWAAASDPNTLYPNTTWIATDMQNGEFIRARGGNSGVATASGLTIGAFQPDALQQHGHGSTSGAKGGGLITDLFDANHFHSGTTDLGGNHDHGIPRTIGAGFSVVGAYPGNGASLDYSVKTDYSGDHTHSFNTNTTTNLNHTHTIQDHYHDVGNIASANAANETRPINVAVIFWRRTN